MLILNSPRSCVTVEITSMSFIMLFTGIGVCHRTYLQGMIKAGKNNFGLERHVFPILSNISRINYKKNLKLIDIDRKDRITYFYHQHIHYWYKLRGITIHIRFSVSDYLWGTKLKGNSTASFQITRNRWCMIHR